MAKKRAAYSLIPRDGNAVIYGMLDDLIEKHHDHLVNARIVLAWNLTWQPDVDGRVTLGKCKKASDLDRELAPFDFVILLRQAFFEDPEVSDAQRLALLDHELCHAELELDENGELKYDTKDRPCYRIRKHDLEEFSEVVMRHGIWRKDIEAFAAALERARDTKGKTPEEIEALRDRVVEAGAVTEARELIDRLKAGENGLDAIDDIMARKLAANPAIQRAIKSLRPKKGSGVDSVTFTHVVDGKPQESVTLHADGRTTGGDAA